MVSSDLRGFSTRGVVGDVNVAPIVWRYQPLCISGIVLHTWFDQRDIGLLLHGKPGYIVNQLLLDGVIGLQAGIWILHDIGLFHLLLQGLLRSCIRTMVLAKVH